MDQALRWSLASCSPAVAHLWSPTALAYSAEVASATKAGRPWHLSTCFVGRNPLKRTLLAYSAEAAASAAKAGRQGFGGHPSLWKGVPCQPTVVENGLPPEALEEFQSD